MSYREINAIKNIAHGFKKSKEYNIGNTKIRFYGSVKLHGTNIEIRFINNEFVGAFTRGGNPININSNFFNSYPYFSSKRFKDAITEFAIINKLNQYNNFSIYGEWAGQGVQKGVGISLLPKQLFLFGAKYKDGETTRNIINDGVDTGEVETIDININIPAHKLIKNDNDVFHLITEFKTFEHEIDFTTDGLTKSAEYLQNLTLEVEDDCPVARKLLPDSTDKLVGEGIVWVSDDGEQIFKVKGEEHSKSKINNRTKNLAKLEIDFELLESVQAFADKYSTEARFNQGYKHIITEVMGMEWSDESELDVKHFGKLLSWVNTDIMKEQSEEFFMITNDVKLLKEKLTIKTKQFFGL